MMISSGSENASHVGSACKSAGARFMQPVVMLSVFPSSMPGSTVTRVTSRGLPRRCSRAMFLTLDPSTLQPASLHQSQARNLHAFGLSSSRVGRAQALARNLAAGLGTDRESEHARLQETLLPAALPEQFPLGFRLRDLSTPGFHRFTTTLFSRTF
jgi:hypothetical protein